MFRQVVLKPVLEAPLPCTFCMSPLSNTPDSTTHHLVSRDCKNWIGCLIIRETYKMCRARGPLGQVWEALVSLASKYRESNFVHTTSDIERQSDIIPLISMESWRFPATRAISTGWVCPATQQSSESFNFMQMKIDFRKRQPIGKKTVELTWSFSS